MAEIIPSNIQDLKLGKSQSELIQNTKTHIDALYDQNSAQATDITNAQKKADDAYLLASRKHKIVAYDTLDAMISALNSATATEFDIGDEIYIKDASYTRDFWVSAKQDTKYTNQTNESGFKADNFDKGYVGYFELSLLDENPEITNMVTSDENITDSKIVLGAGNKKVKGSSYSITINAPSSSSDDNTVPTSKAVNTAISNIGSDTNPVSKATKAIQDENGNPITATYATKAELENAGKVKTVSVNGGTPVEPTEDGNIDLDLSNISVDVEDLKADIKQATLINYPSDSNIQYKAIQMPKTSVVIEVLKKENNEYSSVVTQSIVVGDFTYYLLDKSVTGDYWYREVGGNAVNGGNNIELYSHFIYASTQTKVSVTDISVTPNTSAEGYIYISLQKITPTALSYQTLYNACLSFMDNYGNSPLLPVNGYYSPSDESPALPLIKAYYVSGVLKCEFSAGYGRYIYSDDNKVINIVQDKVIVIVY